MFDPARGFLRIGKKPANQHLVSYGALHGQAG
jgi:hypothetical protein